VSVMKLRGHEHPMPGLADQDAMAGRLQSISEIARRTSLSRNTIKKWLRAPAEAAPKYRREVSPGILTPFLATLTQALTADAPECISKGKARNPYEFGVKVSLAITHKPGLMVGARSFPGNPYDGHALNAQIE
jgi:hypothetical protein